MLQARGRMTKQRGKGDFVETEKDDGLTSTRIETVQHWVEKEKAFFKWRSVPVFHVNAESGEKWSAGVSSRDTGGNDFDLTLTVEETFRCTAYSIISVKSAFDWCWCCASKRLFNRYCQTKIIPPVSLLLTQLTMRVISARPFGSLNDQFRWPCPEFDLRAKKPKKERKKSWILAMLHYVANWRFSRVIDRAQNFFSCGVEIIVENDHMFSEYCLVRNRRRTEEQKSF